MPTKKMQERVPPAKNLKERLSRNLLGFNKHLDMGGLGASTATPKFDPDQPAGKVLGQDAEDGTW